MFGDCSTGTVGVKLHGCNTLHCHRYVLTNLVHGKAAIKPGTLRAIIRGAGITVAEFCDLL